VLKAGQLQEVLGAAQGGNLRRIPFTGKTIVTKDRRKITFVSLGNLRQHEKVV